jgi:hypothetical protein
VNADWKDADLGNADLTNANLRDANLMGAKLTRANLRGADLGNANLTDANLRGADLREADLTHANLTSANLTNAALRGANLRDACLTGANLARTDLTRADLTSAELAWATFSETLLHDTVLSHSKWRDTFLANVNLSAAIGLESITHDGPSHVSTDTVLESYGKLPDVFLRGCGFSNWEIEAARLYDPSLSAHQINDIQYRIFELRAGAPMQISSLFISYAHRDGDFVATLEQKLDEKGIRYWRDVHHATAGRPTRSSTGRCDSIRPCC